MRAYLHCVLVAFALVLAQGGAALAATQIVVEGTPPLFRLTGSALLSGPPPAVFEDIFLIGVDNSELTPMAGRYELKDGTLLFRPQFPLEPGVYYRAKFTLGTESANLSFSLPKLALERTTSVVNVFPTSAVLPQNQLKLYIHFSDAMSRGSAFQRIHIHDADGTEVKLPFLSLAEELWDGEYKRLTVLFDPGRIKRGLVPNRDMGLALMAGRSYTLTIDEDWIDARGVKMKAGFSKTFSVGPEDRTPLDPANWVITAPREGTMAPVTITFPEALDHALLTRVLAIKSVGGAFLDGEVTVRDGETRWSFAPKEPWRTGRYEISVPGILEDLAGNKVYTPFDVDLQETPNAPGPSKTYTVPFAVANRN